METKKCPHCGASMESKWHSITPGLVWVLFKILKRVSDTGKNSIQMKDLNLDHSEYGNFQKLRFHGLIAKDDDNSKHWQVTKRGGEFAKGYISIPRRVETFRNKVIGHDEDYINVKGVMVTDPIWQKAFSGKIQPVISPVDYTNTGQAMMFSL